MAPKIVRDGLPKRPRKYRDASQIALVAKTRSRKGLVIEAPVLIFIKGAPAFQAVYNYLDKIVILENFVVDCRIASTPTNFAHLRHGYRDTAAKTHWPFNTIGSMWLMDAPSRSKKVFATGAMDDRCQMWGRIWRRR